MLVHTLENIGNFISKHKIYTSKARGMEWQMPDFNEFFSEYILGIYRNTAKIKKGVVNRFDTYSNMIGSK